ncbi:hypothetical protein B7R74_08075 [Yersinia pseudotuberculosis]|uniref:DUF4087 domain-containing protein n=1 Tax=Yersinia pseudotuberculosis TaxID=633 RepID=A0A380Q896_YERPU|nr:DUF4087 domain-containing protein [Yersinia pseudotuberculosis]PSH22128.1 hypothetical protein B7R74_08075 [Yersinia pseudotuberculosis]SUP82585.1 Uncharacterised protein [Yersinia pseudotuberculosis]
MRFFFLFTLAGVISVSAVTNSYAANSAERRCGWFENPTPANATLTDRDGMWEIGTQGGYQAKGDWPGFSPAQWVRTGNGNYGYGCTCITADTDPTTQRMNNLTKATARPLSACRTDKSLKEPENPLAEMRQIASYQGNGFSFSYPSTWSVKKEKQCVSLNQPERVAEEEYTLNICVQHGTLEQATDSMIFYNDNGVWMREAGMDAPSPVDIIKGPGWKGMQTTQTCGVSDEETGFHAAGGTCFMAIVYDAKTQLLFDTVGFYQNFDVINMIVQSVKFTEK